MFFFCKQINNEYLFNCASSDVSSNSNIFCRVNAETKREKCINTFLIAEAVCYHARDGVYPKEFRNESFIYDESEYWKRSDDQIMTMCKIKHVYRPQGDEDGKVSETTEVYYVKDGNSTKKVTRKKYKWKTTSKTIKSESNSTKSSKSASEKYENSNDDENEDNDSFVDENNDNLESDNDSDELSEKVINSPKISEELPKKSKLETGNAKKQEKPDEKTIKKAPEVNVKTNKIKSEEIKKKEIDIKTTKLTSDQSVKQPKKIEKTPKETSQTKISDKGNVKMSQIESPIPIPEQSKIKVQEKSKKIEPITVEKKQKSGEAKITTVRSDSSINTDNDSENFASQILMKILKVKNNTSTEQTTIAPNNCDTSSNRSVVPLIIIPILIPINGCSDLSSLNNIKEENLRKTPEFLKTFSNLMNIKYCKKNCFLYCDEKNPLYNYFDETNPMSYPKPIKFNQFVQDYPINYSNNRFCYRFPQNHEPHYGFVGDYPQNYQRKSHSFKHNPYFFNSQYSPYDFP